MHKSIHERPQMAVPRQADTWTAKSQAICKPGPYLGCKAKLQGSGGLNEMGPADVRLCEAPKPLIVDMPAVFFSEEADFLERGARHQPAGWRREVVDPEHRAIG